MRFFFLLGAIWFALMGGFFFSYSATVLPGLAQLTPELGMHAMQTINVTVGNAYFLVGFWGAAAFMVLGLVFSLTLRPVGWFWMFLASLIYLIGAFFTTIWGIVPANRDLAELTSTSPAGVAAWASYQTHWLLLNDIRTVGALAAALVMTLWVVWYGGRRR